MRILTIAKEMGPGGTERAAQNGVIAYRRAGHDTAVLSIDKGGTRAEALAADGVPVWIGGPAATDVDRALAQAAAWRPEFVHLHRPGMADASTARVLRALRSSSVTRLPVIETNHFSRCDRSSDGAMIDAHMHMSEWCLWKWQQWARGVRPAPLGVVQPHLIDASAFHRVANERREARRTQWGITPGTFAFGRLGQPFTVGWSPVMFDAFEKFAPSRPRAVLVVVGLPDSLRPRLAALPPSIRARVLDRPFVHGDQNLRECYSALDCFLHAKHIGESFGYVLVESMLCGCPIISLSTPTRDNSQLEVVGHERGGLMVTDADSMAQAMLRLHDDADLRQRLATDGARSVQQRFAWDHVAARLMSLVEIIAGEPDRSQQRRQLIDAGFVTDVPARRINELMSQVMGRQRPMTRTIMRLGHQPHMYAGFVRAKALLTRLRAR